MKSVSLAIASLLISCICTAQSSSTVSLSNGVQLRISASIGQPTGQQDVKIQMTPASGNSIYRIFRDQNNLAVFAYQLAVDRSQDGAEFILTATPAENEFAARFPNADGGKPVPTLSADKTFPSLRSGAVAEIGLFELAGVGLKVIDSVQVRLNQNGTATLDSTPDSTQGRLRFSGLRITINNMPVAGTGGRSSLAGRYAMFYIPDHGGYFFSTDQPPGRQFVKIATVDRTHLRFVLDNDIYECIADAPILTGLDSGELWVYHDASYRPSGNWTKNLRAGNEQSRKSPADSPEFFAATSDSLNWWLP